MIRVERARNPQILEVHRTHAHVYAKCFRIRVVDRCRRRSDGRSGCIRRELTIRILISFFENKRANSFVNVRPMFQSRDFLRLLLEVRCPGFYRASAALRELLEEELITGFYLRMTSYVITIHIDIYLSFTNEGTFVLFIVDTFVFISLCFIIRTDERMNIHKSYKLTRTNE